MSTFLSVANRARTFDCSKILQQIDSGILLIDQSNKIVLWNSWLEEASGISANHAIGQKLNTLFSNKIKGRLVQAIEHALNKQLSSVLSSSLNRYVLPLYSSHLDNNKSRIPISQSITVKPTIDDNGSCFCLIHIADVTDVIRRETLLKQRGVDLKQLAHDKAISELRIRSIIENTLDSIITFNQSGLISSLNPATRRLFGLPKEQCQPIYLQSLFNELQEYMGEPIDGIINALGYFSVDVNKSWPEATGLRHGKDPFSVEIAVTPIDVHEEILFTAVIRDISERKRSEERLVKLAQYDSLTGLANRSLFYSHLEYLILRTRRTHKSSALLLLDLDKFKSINDTMGHDVGDLVLQHVAEKLREHIRDVDLAARLGGDEFAVLLEESGTEAEVSQVTERICRAISSTVILKGHEVNISSSIGISVINELERNSEDLIKCADVAMYYAKERGRDNYQFYTPQLRQISEVKLNLENSLQNALTNEEFELHYQPKFDISSSKVIGCEALLRWKHPNLGFVPPESFIPLLEETGLIKQVGIWVLQEACKQCKQWLDNKLVNSDFTIAVNLSSRQVKPGETAEMIFNITEEYGLDRKNLDIELTEKTLMEGCNNPIELLIELKNIGVSISIDDFGTGLSSLSNLKNFPIDNLKIDQSFISNLNTSADSTSIVDTIIIIAQNLDMKVIAEGVEDQPTLDYLAKQGCDMAQGFLLAEPMNPNNFDEFVREQAA